MEEIKLKQVAQLTDSGFNEMTGRVYDSSGLCPAIRTMGGGNLEPKIMEEPIIYDDYNGRIKADQSTVGTLTTNCGNDAERNGVKIIEPMTTRGYKGVIEPIAFDEQNKCIRQNGTVGTLTTDGSSPKHNNRIIEPDYRIRKLTPKECWRLMDFDDEDFYRTAYGRECPVEFAKKVEKRNLKKDEWKVLWRYMRHQQVSNSQLYRQAGNSIVVSVLEAIFKQML